MEGGGVGNNQYNISCYDTIMWGGGGGVGNNQYNISCCETIMWRWGGGGGGGGLGNNQYIICYETVMCVCVCGGGVGNNQYNISCDKVNMGGKTVNVHSPYCLCILHLPCELFIYYKSVLNPFIL